ncbi:MAG TPA: chromate transporter [Vicinamibacterales bacterium]|nr:chromate transporter [Vicinamibacterales bacterium]
MAELVLYFLKLGSIGFGGPAALVGYMRRDLVERRRLIDESTYNLSIALAQIMPGPLAAQTAMAIGYFHSGLIGASLVGLAFVLPSFVMVLALSITYVAYGGMPWMQAVFYGIGAVIIPIVAIAAYRLARGTNKQDALLWAIFLITLAATVWTGTELAVIFIVSGLAVLVVRAWPGLRAGLVLIAGGLTGAVAIGFLEHGLSGMSASSGQPLLMQIFLFFGKAGSFVFGSGLAIVPFLRQGVVHDFGWLTDHQFLDAVAVALITPGPVVITVAFIGYLVGGVAGSVVAAAGMFLPVYVFTAVPAPWFARHRHNAQLRAFATGATSAASGAIAGAVVVLGRQAIVDVPTICIALVGWLLLVRVRAPEPLLVLGAGIAGLLWSRFAL